MHVYVYTHTYIFISVENNVYPLFSSSHSSSHKEHLRFPLVYHNQKTCLFPVTLAPPNVTNKKYTTHNVHETAHKCTTHILKQHNSLEENIKGYSHDRNQERKDDSKGRQSVNVRQKGCFSYGTQNEHLDLNVVSVPEEGQH